MKKHRNKVIQSLLNHRSIRRFTKEMVSEEDIETIISTAVRAPTAGNLQSYSLIVIDDFDKKKALGLSHVPLVVIAVADQNRNKKRFESSGAPFNFDKGINLFVSYWDAIIALHNLVITAESIGLGAYYIGRILKMDVADVLNLPQYVFPAGLVCIGYPDEKPELMPRLPLDAVVHRNSYHDPDRKDIQRYYKHIDNTWDAMPSDRLEKLSRRGINNHAQMIAKNRYSEKSLQTEETGLAGNLERSGFKLRIVR